MIIPATLIIYMGDLPLTPFFAVIELVFNLAMLLCNFFVTPVIPKYLFLAFRYDVDH